MIQRTARVAVILLACAIALRSSPADDVPVVREDGVGPAKVGMTLRQLSAALGQTFVLPKSKDEQSCFYADPSKYPQVLLMIENGRLSRIDVTKPGIATTKGIQVGDTEAHALEVYGRALKVEPHAYLRETGHYLTHRSRTGQYGIRFETEAGKITRFYAGRFESIQYIEGCE